MGESRVLGMAYREQKRGPMLLRDKVCVRPECGVEQDFRGKPGRCCAAACVGLVMLCTGVNVRTHAPYSTA